MTSLRPRSGGSLLLPGSLALRLTSARADLVLETETAELGKQGDQLISTAVRYERESDGSHVWFTLNQYEIGVTDRTKDRSIFAEIFGNSSPARGQDGTVAGAIATEYHFSKTVNTFVSVGYDTEALLSIRPGFNIEF